MRKRKIYGYIKRRIYNTSYQLKTSIQYFDDNQTKSMEQSLYINNLNTKPNEILI